MGTIALSSLSARRKHGAEVVRAETTVPSLPLPLTSTAAPTTPLMYSESLVA